ncbi:GNAT family N-acetyltransferase [Nonlabens antarcticus]|uniref:GNAT family N-acetyltransferase n=1 Tax=Nonlabens antarcticus TaxID=392714 RepID=UPI001891308F|nr:GNAT family N-acetyltransferase [Nonlabens antarcticus]
MSNDSIQHKHNDRRGIFFLKEDDQTIAELTYSLEDGVMTIDHTETNPSHEGKGLGGKMVEESYAFAKANNLKINPLCPFAEVMFDRNPEWSAVRVG